MCRDKTFVPAIKLFVREGIHSIVTREVQKTRDGEKNVTSENNSPPTVSPGSELGRSEDFKQVLTQIVLSAPRSLHLPHIYPSICSSVWTK